MKPAYEPIRFPFDKRKADTAIAYILQREPDIEPLKLAIMLFLADKEHLVRYGRPIFGGTWLATHAGPIHKEACEGWLNIDSPWLPHGAFSSWRRGIWG